ncbi:hypothetical protein KDK77_04765 [bacterium]|nr:hypothetical protein [bacterium]
MHIFYLFFLFIILFASGFIYLLVYNRVSRKTFSLLLFLRWCVLGLLVWLMANPTITFSLLREKPHWINCIVDTSQSMSIADEHNGTAHRIDAVRQTLAGLSARKDFSHIRVFRTGNTLSATSIDTLSAEDTSSPLYSSLTDFFRQTDESLPDVYLFLDVLATDKITGLTFPSPINTVLAGSVEEQTDIAVDSIDISSPLEINQKTAITVHVSGHKIHPNLPATLTLSDENNEIIGIKTITAPFADYYSFSYTPKKLGPLIITGSISTTEITEPYLHNNQVQTGTIVNKNIFKILVAGQPSWDMGFILRAIASLENIELEIYNVIGTAKKEFFSLSTHKTIPSNDLFSHLDTIDGIIFCNMPLAILAHTDTQQLIQFVTAKGGGIFFLGGPDTFGSGTQSGLFSLLPFQLNSGDFRTQPIKAFSPPSIQNRSPFSQFIKKIDFSQFPPLDGFNSVDSLKLTAEVHLKIRTSQGKEYPLLISSKAGNGKVIAFTGRGIYKWDLAAQNNSSTILPLIKSIIGWIAAPSDDAFMHVHLPRLNYSLGEKVPLQVTMLNALYEPTVEGTVSGTITQPDGSKTAAEFLPLLDTAGTVSYTYFPSLPGKHFIELEGTTPAGEVSHATSYCIVHQPTEEFRFITAQKDTLREIAEKSGGAFFTLSQFEAFIAERSASRGYERMEITRLVIDYPVILLFLVGLMASEWYIRIKKGLS